MKTVQEAGPAELAAFKRRNIRTLAMGDISQADCDEINIHVDAVQAVLDRYNKEG